MHYLYLPYGGFGKFNVSSSKASRNILESWADPSHPPTTNVNRMSKLHAAIIFWVGTPFLPIYITKLELATDAGTWVPSVAPMQS